MTTITSIMNIVDPGLHTTIQDIGRVGYQQVGIVPSGPMDPLAFQLANVLVTNSKDAAGLEITMVGPNILFLEDCVVAITGAHLSPSVDGRKIPMWSSVYIHKGEELRFGKPKHGARAYLAVAGGIRTKEILGSRSTYTKAKLGGMNGEALKQEDELPGVVHTKQMLRAISGKHLSEKLRPRYIRHQMVRVIPDEQESYFTEEALQIFYTHSFKVTPQSDRMGYRLQGRKLTHQENIELFSEAVAFGSIQVPSGGDPIVLMADRQTTGGYPKIGTIITHDLWKVAQLLPGQTLSFQKSTLEEAHRWLTYEKNFFQMIEMAVKRK